MALRELECVSVIRVLAADAHPLYREGIARVVRQRPSLQLVAELGDGGVAIEVIERLRPDVAVMDPGMPGLDAGRVLRTMGRDGPTTRAVFLAGTVRATDAYEAIANGAAAYLSKRATGEEIEDAICRAARGETTIARELQTGVATQIRLRQRPSHPTLSPRELQVLRFFPSGMTAREIAAELVVATTTVRTHIERICEKLGVRDRAAAVAVAMRAGLLD